MLMAKQKKKKKKKKQSVTKATGICRQRMQNSHFWVDANN